ncbi:hypothetical protein H6G33_10100 [Calothrix sp. FACHB-1219]|uniref:hypothetical protein n=1 Tax=unclassified Calothrix TaxID=2619626 RepID=UPI00168303CB|nr:MULTISPECIES: hypothetical protein [unclassified Calothrix]MBD2201699.1 hypothetical protein [Calothrix sp. FACHB-168]MBD2217385.1 hypothetical protein [Calothrix sp. FACHB-1219]
MKYIHVYLIVLTIVAIWKVKDESDKRKAKFKRAYLVKVESEEECTVDDWIYDEAKRKAEEKFIKNNEQEKKETIEKYGEEIWYETVGYKETDYQIIKKDSFRVFPLEIENYLNDEDEIILDLGETEEGDEI